MGQGAREGLGEGLGRAVVNRGLGEGVRGCGVNGGLGGGLRECWGEWGFRRRGLGSVG